MGSPPPPHPLSNYDVQGHVIGPAVSHAPTEQETGKWSPGLWLRDRRHDNKKCATSGNIGQR